MVSARPHITGSQRAATHAECAGCAYFREEQMDTGYCRLHKMYVLRTFDCSKFVANHVISMKGGDAGP